MKFHYKVTINNPSHHIVEVKLKLTANSFPQQIEVFLPSWSPGSYLMREYAKHLRKLRIENHLGEFLYFVQKSKNSWLIDLERSEGKVTGEIFLSYEVYAHELTVRTSHITREHAFLHGPTYLLGVKGEIGRGATIEFNFPPSWSKISTALTDISQQREHFLYQAKDYDDLLDSPVEIGCHQTDGFMVNGIPHELAFYGRTLPIRINMKEDIKRIVEFISNAMGEIPYSRYLFLAHFVPNLYGGLEHANSTALQFDGRKLANRKDYINWLALVSHEYFHTWNVKRIRPKELGPFDYQQEAYTRMLWLAEGLTSFMDELFIYQSGLISIEEYLEMQKNNLNNYYRVKGRRFDSLEDSSFNAWIKLYRPDENSANSTVSYYLKGGIVFWALNALLFKQGSNMGALLKLLWQRYKSNPQVGLTRDEVYVMIEQLAGKDVRSEFEMMIETTEELDLVKLFSLAGLRLEFSQEEGAYLGFTATNKGDNILIKSVELDGPAFKSGLNAGDEILAINNQRVYFNEFNDFKKMLLIDVPYHFLICRTGEIMEVEVIAESYHKQVKKIEVDDLAKVEECLKYKY